MPSFVLTAKIRKDEIAVACRDTKTGKALSFTLLFREVAEALLKELEKNPEVQIKWE